MAGILAIAMLSCRGNTQQTAEANPSAPATQEQSATDSTQVQQATAADAQAQTQALPEAITAFLQKHFPNATVARVETDNVFGGVESDVTLSDGTEVDFDTKNEWEQVDCHAKAVPAALVPNAIANYVKNNNKGMAIVKIDKKNVGYEIELSNGVDLRFDAKGKFVGIDD